MQITLETLHDEESRAALIDNLIRMVADGHIVTVLDFIPVEERVPEDDLEVLLRVVHLPSENESVQSASRDGDMWQDIAGMYCTNEVYVPTHYAEIPEMK